MRQIYAREAAIKSPKEILETLEVDNDTGLTNEEAVVRLAKFGPNTLHHMTKQSVIKKYFEQFSEPMILLLLVSACISFILKQYDDSVSITFAVIIVVSVAFVQNYRSEKALEALKQFMPHKCNCLRGGHLLNFLASDLVPGDIVYLSTGDRVPADLRLCEAVDMRMDESSLTGETEAVLKTVSTLTFHSPSSSVINGSRAPANHRQTDCSTAADTVDVHQRSSSLLRRPLQPCTDWDSEVPSGTVLASDRCTLNTFPSGNDGVLRSNSKSSLETNSGGSSSSGNTVVVSLPGDRGGGEEEATALNQLRGCHELTNIAFMGTMVCCGVGKGVVIGTGEHSEFGKVFSLMKSEESPRTPLQKSMDKLGKQLSFFSILIISSIVLVGLFQRRGLLQLINIGVSLAVAAIPEGLPIVVAVTLAIGQMRMAARNAIVRRLPAVETLGCVNVVCVDKTGTMTRNEMTASQLVSGDLESFFVPPSQSDLQQYSAVYPPPPPHLARSQSSTMASPSALSAYQCYSTGELYSSHLTPCLPQFQDVIKIGTLCNNAVLQNGQLHGQPTEGALLRLAVQMNVGDHRSQYTRVQEWPFSSDTKMMMVSCLPNSRMQKDRQLIYFAKGAVDRILDRCAYIPERDTSPLHTVVSNSPVVTAGVPITMPIDSRPSEDRSQQLTPTQKLTGDDECLVELTPGRAQAVLSEAALIGSRGLRVLALAEGSEPSRMTFRGLVGLMDPLRTGVEESVQLLLSTGVRVIMITGDAMETACAVGAQLGLHRPGDMCLSGEDVEQLSLDALKLRTRGVTIFYRSGARHKCKIVKALQKCGLVVAMTGDGVNDAVALKSSDIGVAMGCSGTDVCREASDIVLLDDNFATILAAMEEGKAIFHNIRNFVGFQLSTSIAALSLIALSTLFSLPTPLNAMQILYINILMDGPPAQSLGVEPPEESIVKQPPRRVVDSLLDARLIINVVIAATTIVIGTLWIFYLELDDNNQATTRDTTMTFTCFVFFDIFNALSFRCQKKSIFSLGFFSNRMFVIAAGLSLFGQLMVVYLPPLQAIFQTEALSLKDITLLVLVSSSVFFISEIRKLVGSRRHIQFRFPVQLPHWSKLVNHLHPKVKLDNSMV